jgi:hypothetical protein
VPGVPPNGVVVESHGPPVDVVVDAVNANWAPDPMLLMVRRFEAGFAPLTERLRRLLDSNVGRTVSVTGTTTFPLAD